MYQGVRSVCFSENLTCFAFLLPPFSDSPLLPANQIQQWRNSKNIRNLLKWHITWLTIHMHCASAFNVYYQFNFSVRSYCFFFYQRPDNLPECFWPSYVWLLKFSLGRRSRRVFQMYSVKKVFLKVLQNSQENNCARVSFLKKLQATVRRTAKFMQYSLDLFQDFSSI